MRSHFPLPLPKHCKARGKRKPEVGGGGVNRDCQWILPDQAVAAVARLDDAPGTGERGQALIESGGADATV